MNTSEKTYTLTETNLKQILKQMYIVAHADANSEGWPMQEHELEDALHTAMIVADAFTEGESL